MNIFRRGKVQPIGILQNFSQTNMEGQHFWLKILQRVEEGSFPTWWRNLFKPFVTPGERKKREWLPNFKPVSVGAIFTLRILASNTLCVSLRPHASMQFGHNQEGKLFSLVWSIDFQYDKLIEQNFGHQVENWLLAVWYSHITRNIRKLSKTR